MQDNVTATECRGWPYANPHSVLKRKADILSTIYDISIHQ